MVTSFDDAWKPISDASEVTSSGNGVGVTVVDSFTAQASLAPGLAWRPLEPAIELEVTAMYLANRPPGALAASFLKTFGTTIEHH